MKKSCADMKNHATEIISYETKEMLPLTDGEIESNKIQKFCHICKKKFSDVNVSCDKNDSNDDKDNEKNNIRTFHGDIAGLDDVDGDSCDYDNDGDDDCGGEKNWQQNVLW